MRWMLLTETYPPEINGVAMTLSNITEGMVARGHKVLIMRPQQSKYDKPIPEPANPAHRLVWGFPFPWYKDLKIGFPYFGQMLRNIDRFRPDLLHIATEGPLGLAGVMAAHAYGVPVVSSYHTNFFTYSRMYGAGFLRGLAFIYFRALHNATLKTFVPSQTALTKVAGYKYKNLDIMSRGVDTVLFNPARRDNDLRKSWGVGPDDIVMLYVGRVAPEKNLEVMIAAYERLRHKSPSAKMVFVGDGPSRKMLEDRYPHFIFAGKKTDIDLARHYASADLFVFSSLTETYGNVVMEAMASGLKILAYDYAGAREHVTDGVNGYLAGFHNETDFHEKFDKLIADRARWPQIAAAARAKTEELSWENVVAKYEKTVLGFTKCQPLPHSPSA